MGGSVGVGALIVGVALIGVFVIANSSINAQMEASLEAIQAADDPLPSISFVDANLDEDALLEFQINAVGSGYPNSGFIQATGGGGSGFHCSYTAVAGSLTGFTILSHGSGYTTTPTLTATGCGGTCTPATFHNFRFGNALFGNLTNDGVVTIEVEDMWISADGDEPEELSPDSYDSFDTFFPGEVISIEYLQGGVSGSVTSLSVTGFGAVASIGV